MDDDFAKKYGLLTDEDLRRIDERMRKTEDEGLKNLLKHFDRIHDKLFTFNNILIGGYFALSKFTNSLSIWYILIPISNLAFLIYIEYRMVQKSKFESEITHKTKKEIDEWGKSINTTNLYSILSIFTTLAVTVFLLIHLL
ncbi:MAG: hypothetical protein HYR66_00970 [Sphingobacteriales bacterium]|nr:hypothetical protein [Sphingobacteriales bacterium]MBI3719198.1 hypothetical protein [Sphingobacteriales bacterium]